MRGLAINVEMPAPYLSLDHLVPAMARAVVRANRNKEKQDDQEVFAAASLEWEGRLRALAHANGIKGHHRETLAAHEWDHLDIDRDAFYVGDLNGCRELTDFGFRFEVVRDDREQLEMDASFFETLLNGTLLNWRYWLRMPKLGVEHAARLMAGLDPDLYADLAARPTKTDPRKNCQRAVSIERLARAEERLTDTPAGWLRWAEERELPVHLGFALAVEDKRQLDEAAAALKRLPLEEAAHWDNARDVGDGERQVTFKFASLSNSFNCTLPRFVEVVTERLERWKAGQYLIVEAAQLLQNVNRASSAERLCRQMESAIHNGKLKLRENGVPLEQGEVPAGRLFNLTVRADDVNDWLNASAAGMTLRYPYGQFEQSQAWEQNRYRAPLHARLEPKTPWTGGRLADGDYLPIADAARLASKHAGQDVTVRDFLRAGARDEILIRVICPRAVRMMPTREGDISKSMPAHSYPDLPPEACKVLSIHGKATWRTHEFAEPRPEYGGEVCFYTRWQLPDSEPDLECTIDDCLVLGYHVHALADAFKQAPAVEAPAVAAPPPPVLAPATPPAPVRAIEGAKAVAPERPVQSASGPVFSMTRAALVKSHEHHWPTIQSDLKNASTNGLSKAKAASRDWNEALALEWARANNKLVEEAPELADPLGQAMRNLASLPSRKNALKG